MILIIGVIELVLFYSAYLCKQFMQKSQGIKTNQLGKGNKAQKTIIIERILNSISIINVFIMFVSVILNTSFFTYQIARFAGLILFAAGTCIFIVSIITMKDSWRAGIPYKDKTALVTNGIYRVSRNPAFLGFDLTYIGICFTFGNIYLLLTVIINIVILHLQILEEEKYLENVFHKDYVTYKNKVGRYFIFF